VCVDKCVVTKCGGGRRRRRRRSPGYRIKNKNPTQRCGEKICVLVCWQCFHKNSIYNEKSNAYGSKATLLFIPKVVVDVPHKMGNDMEN